MSGKKIKAAKEVKPNPAQPDAAQRADADSTQRTIRVEDAASILGISRAAAYRYAKDGELPVIRIGQRVLVLKAAFEKQFFAGA
jgi:excisionase family DNA binding protein